jgi:hypothetical protein
MGGGSADAIMHVGVPHRFVIFIERPTDNRRRIDDTVMMTDGGLAEQHLCNYQVQNQRIVIVEKIVCNFE